MKLICLNTWGGRVGCENLLNFFKSWNEKVDLFCLQEMWDNDSSADKTVLNNSIYRLKNILLNYEFLNSPQNNSFENVVTFYKSSLNQTFENDFYICRAEIKYANEIKIQNRLAIHNQFSIGGKLLNIINLHGLWTGTGKDDTPERLEQSKNILEYLETLEGGVVLCGDFNLKRNTKSVKMLEDFGLKNLIKEFRVTSTRSKFYKHFEKDADYVFVNNGVKVHDFKVLDEHISDHLPLFLDFEV